MVSRPHVDTVTSTNAILADGEGPRPTWAELTAFVKSNHELSDVAKSVVSRLRELTDQPHLSPPISLDGDGRLRCGSASDRVCDLSWTVPDLKDMFERRWEEDEDTLWPLQPLVVEWQMSRRTIEPDRRPTGILPSSCKITTTARPEPTPPHLLMPGELGQAKFPPDIGRLPVFAGRGAAETAPTFVMYDFSGLPKTGTGGRGAPLHMRVWHELVMSVPIEFRGEGVVRVTIETRDLISYLWPHGNFRPVKHWDKLRRCLAAMGQLYLPFGDDLWAVVTTRRMPGSPDGWLTIDVSVPPGTGHGPLVHRGLLRKYGVESAALYRGYLACCIMWDQYGSTPKGVVQATRPVADRDDNGYLLDARGERIFEKGKLVKRWNHPKAVYSGARERNPAVEQFYPVLNDSAIVRIINPLAKPTNNPHRQVREAWGVFEELDAHNVITMERAKTRDGRDGLRIMPPSGWGPQWCPPEGVLLTSQERSTNVGGAFY